MTATDLQDELQETNAAFSAAVLRGDAAGMANAYMENGAVLPTYVAHRLVGNEFCLSPLSLCPVHILHKCTELEEPQQHKLRQPYWIDDTRYSKRGGVAGD